MRPRRKSLLVGPSLDDYLLQQADSLLNQQYHSLQHEVKTIVYTSRAVLDTVAGTPIHVLRGKRIVGVRVNVAGAPVTNPLDADILRDGNSIFTSIDSKPTVPAGVLYGYRFTVQSGEVFVDSKVQCKINTVSSATGPAVFEIEYVDGESY